MPGLPGLLAVGPASGLQGPLAAARRNAPRSVITGPPLRRAFLCLALSACRPLFTPAMNNPMSPLKAFLQAYKEPLQEFALCALAYLLGALLLFLMMFL